jgi:hypothetical protein
LKKVEGITEKVGMAFATFNVPNAEHAVNIVKLTIEQICSKTGIPLPRWLYPSKVKGGWLDGLI